MNVELLVRGIVGVAIFGLIVFSIIKSKNTKRKLLSVLGISFLIFIMLSWVIPVGTYTKGKLSTAGFSPLGLGDIFNKPLSALMTFALYGVVFAVIGGFYGVAEESGAFDKVVTKMSNVFERRTLINILKGVLKYVAIATGASILVSYIYSSCMDYKDFGSLFNFDRLVEALKFGLTIFVSLFALMALTFGSTVPFKKENKFLVLTIVLFTLLSSMTGLVFPLFVLVPLFAAVLFRQNFDKITVLAATVGSLLLGNVTSTYGFNITGYTKNVMALKDMNFEIVPRIIILVLLIVLYTLWIVKNSRKEEKSIKNEIKKAIVKETKKEDKKKVVKKATKKTTARKSTKKGNTKALAVLPDMIKVSKKDHVKGKGFATLLVIMLVVAFLGMYNWYYSFGVEVFAKAHEAIMGVKIKDFAIFESILGGVSQFGYWSNLEFAGLLVLTSMLIAFVYKMSADKFIESFISGMRKWLPTAIYAALASVILVVLYAALQSGGGTIVNTICANIMDFSDGFNPLLTGLASFIGSFFYNDFYYLLATMSSFTEGYKGVDLSVASLAIQSFYSIAMMIFPTSILLISGLSIFDVSYKDWIKYIWRFLAVTALIVLIVCSIIVLL